MCQMLFFLYSPNNKESREARASVGRAAALSRLCARVAVSRFQQKRRRHPSLDDCSYVTVVGWYTALPTAILTCTSKNERSSARSPRVSAIGAEVN